jgi:hypothetical protein
MRQAVAASGLTDLDVGLDFTSASGHGWLA